jgi:hypothetical protein
MLHEFIASFRAGDTRQQGLTGCPEIGIVGIKEAAGGYIDS